MVPTVLPIILSGWLVLDLLSHQAKAEYQAFLDTLATDTYRYLTAADSNDDGFLDGWMDTFTPATGLLFSIGRINGKGDEFDELSPIAITYNVDSTPSNRFPRVLSDNPGKTQVEIRFTLSAEDAAADLTLFLHAAAMGGASGVRLYCNSTFQQTITLGGSNTEVRVDIAAGTFTSGQNTIKLQIPCTYCNKWLVWDAIHLGRTDSLSTWHQPDQGNSFDNKCNVEEAAMYMVSHIGAWDMGLIDTATAAVRIDHSLDGFRAKPKVDGKYYRFYNTHKGGNELIVDDKRPSISLAFLATSLIITEQWAKEQGQTTQAGKAVSLLQELDLRAFWNPSSHLFYHDSTLQSQWDFFSDEGRLLSFMAYALSQITWEELTLNLQTLQRPTRWYDVANATTRDAPTGPDDIRVADSSWDGSLFTYLAASLFIDDNQSSYLNNTIDPAVKAQIRYAANKGYQLNGETIWGISDCFNSVQYCSEYQGALPNNANFLGSNTIESCPGLITPHASALGLLSERHLDAVANLARLAAYPGLYHPYYGFKDSVETATGKVTERILTLDQLWLFLSLANYQKDTLHRYFYKDTRSRRAHIALYRERGIPGTGGAAEAIAGLQVLSEAGGASSQSAWFADIDGSGKVQFDDILSSLQKSGNP